MRDAILACLRCSVLPLTTVAVADRIGQRRERVQCEMLLMHLERLITQAGWVEMDGRQRPTFQASDASREAIVYGMPSLRRAVLGK